MLMRKVLRAVCALSIFVSPLDAEVKNPDTFVHLTNGDTDSLDPAWAFDTASNSILANVYECLLAFKGSGLSDKDMIGRVAERVPSRDNKLLSKDGKTYTFPIRQGIRFHDGSTLTPEDVRYSLLRFMLLDRDGGPSSLLLEPILGVASTRERDGKLSAEMYRKADSAVAVKDGAVVIRLAKPFAPFLSIVASYGAVVPQKWCAEHGQWDGKPETMAQFNNPKREDSYLMEHANGTGPFTIERVDKKTKEVVLQRHDAYWRGPAKLKRAIVKVIDEFTARKLMISAGDADAVYAPQMYLPQLQAIPGVEAIDDLQNLERSPIIFFTFSINPAANANIGSGRLDGEGIPPDFFADKDLRRAFAYSMDYDAYIRDILKGKGRQAVSFIPPGLLGYRRDLRKYTLDRKKAEDHFRRAFGGKVWETGFKFTIVHNAGSSPAQSICSMLKTKVEAVNAKFKIDVRSLQWSSYLEQTQASKIPLYLGAWQADYPDPHSFAFPLLHSRGSFPDKQHYKNPEADRLIEEAAETLDLKKREKLYGRLQEIVYEDVPQLHLAEGARYRTQRTWVKGYVFNPIFPDAPYGSYFYDLSKEEK